MVDSIRVLPPGFRITDANDNPLSGALIDIFDAGTTTRRTSFSTAALTGGTENSNPVVCDAGGLVPAIYVGTGAYKLVVTSSSGAPVFTEDNITGAFDTSGLSTEFAKPETPVIVKTSNYTVVAGDIGKVITANPTGGTFTITLASAATVGDGSLISIKHVGTANRVVVAGAGGQTVDGQSTLVLQNPGDAVELVSDGANWSAASITRGPLPPTVQVVSMALTAPPASPISGDFYIPLAPATGAWTGLENLLVQADGLGGWFSRTPLQGQVVADLNADVQKVWDGTAWRKLIADNDSAAVQALGVLTKSFTSSDQTMTAAAAISVTHGMGIKPRIINLWLKCVSAEGGYSVGDEVALNPQGDSDGVTARGLSCTRSTTDVFIRFSSNNPIIVNKSNGSTFGITYANWRLIVEAFA